MTTAATIISAAFREGNVVSLGETSPQAALDEALVILNNYANSLFGHEIPARLKDWPIPFPLVGAPLISDFPLRQIQTDAVPSDPDLYLYPQCSARLVVGALGAPATIYFPYQPWDGARISFVDVGMDGDLTLNANKRLIEGAASVTITVPVVGLSPKKTWFYRADLSEWVLLANLALTDEMPLPAEFDDLWITALSIRLSSRYRKDVDDTTLLRFKEMREHLQARYRDQTPVAGKADEIPETAQVGRGFSSCSSASAGAL